MTRILVTGGRNFEDKAFVFAVLDRLKEQHMSMSVIVGDARGVDAIAAKWAKRRGVPIETYYADWSAWGANAGPMRNARMLLQGDPQLVVAFPGGRGTADMIRRAERAGRRVVSAEEVLETDHV